MALASQPPVCGLQVSEHVYCCVNGSDAAAAATTITNVLLWQVVADALGMLNVLSSSPPLLLRTPSLSLLRQHCQVLSRSFPSISQTPNNSTRPCPPPSFLDPKPSQSHPSATLTLHCATRCCCSSTEAVMLSLSLPPSLPPPLPLPLPLPPPAALPPASGFTPRF